MRQAKALLYILMILFNLTSSIQSRNTMLRLTDEKIELLRGLIGYSFESIDMGSIEKSSMKLFTYDSYNLKMLITITRKNRYKQISIESSFIETNDGDMFYDYTIEQLNSSEKEIRDDRNIESKPKLINTIKRMLVRSSLPNVNKLIFCSPHIEQIWAYGRKFNINDVINITDYPEIFKNFEKFDRTDDVFIFKCENGQEVLLHFDDFLHLLTITSNRDEIKSFWQNHAELYENHLIIE